MHSLSITLSLLQPGGALIERRALKIKVLQTHSEGQRIFKR